MSLLSLSSQTKVDKILIQYGYFSAENLESIKKEANKAREPFLTYLLNNKKISEEAITRILAKINNLPYVNLSTAFIDPKFLGLLPQDIAEKYMAIPLGEEQQNLVVAMVDADNVQVVDFLSNKIGIPLKVYSASETGVKRVLKQYQSIIDKDFGKPLEKDGESKQDESPINRQVNKLVVDVTSDSPVSKTLTTILEYAAANGASDIHVEPLEYNLKIRCRIDGILRELMVLPKSTEAALISRIKILSNLKIDEHRIPQDGQFTIKISKREIDLRIAIAPVVWGEQVVIRLLDKTETNLKIDEMGFTGRSLRTIKEALKQSSGMVLTSGPTGSGKSTTLYALIQEIKNDSINIVTLEDPVEYKIEGVNQMQVNPEIGLTFAAGLRSILRQDPNVVMVGEIRDAETAGLAVQASLTGHLVLSTLHTNSASGILPRLLDMSVEPFLIASTVHTVIGQRLVRRINPEKQSYQSSSVETEAIHATLGDILPKTQAEVAKVSHDLGYDSLPLANQNAYTLYKGVESPNFPNGYKGRIGLYEVFEVTQQIQDLIIKRATSAEIQKVAQSQGMIEMRQDGYLKALSGVTTLAEVDRVAATDAA
ncbi:MAG TPA: ATPase, T2SS/T4P/T4SS family [Candidatus Saccharimonadia bacterium]|nr:ATPase, T2SS/T4P/T4SS family [Candidatus Saccharimonadia bacterium]